ncbi:Arf-domain-containing protein [Thelephora ganbajun]|uniref:Arf-domain-containing protein n=1 Tax=Thelephora ganbajun TaxID=370292 RepID=A0ACB6ZJ89_THEGA|nr:Arf-domain-containing protein [Thelephora ganbajun]
MGCTISRPLSDEEIRTQLYLRVIWSLWTHLRSVSVGILMVGLDAAGKTTILHKLKPGENATTISFNIETIEYKNIPFTVLDIGGQDKTCLLWRHCWSIRTSIHTPHFSVQLDDSRFPGYPGYHLRRRFKRSGTYFMRLARSCNESADIIDIFGLYKLRQRMWFIQSSCAISGDGLHEGLEWLIDNIKRHVLAPLMSSDVTADIN